MSTEINKAFVQQFSDNLLMLAQQKGTRLMGSVRVKKTVGKYDHFDRIGKVSAQKRTSRHGDTPQIDTPHSRRRVVLDDYEWADLIDRQDEIRMITDPRSAYAQSGGNALGRKMDELILDAATGNATSVDSADAGSNVALPAGQIIDEDFGTADSNLTLAKLIEAKRILDKNEISSENRTLVHNASALANLLNDTTVTSADYNSIKALVRGDIDTFLGFKFVKTELLNGTADGTDTDPVLCIAMQKDAMGLAMGQDITVRISERDDKSYATQVYASMTMGATRIEDEGVVSIQCVQSA
jgi:hypothetical protein